jgi:hypothetical protein
MTDYDRPASLPAGDAAVAVARSNATEGVGPAVAFETLSYDRSATAEPFESTERPA